MDRPTLYDLPSPPPGKTGWPWDVPKSARSALRGEQFWPKISVATPSYNQVQFVEETLRSVLLQGYPNLEYIVMDGGSTDGSVELIRSYAPWIQVLRIGPDGGQSAAIAAGFREATGDILAWLNSDDRYLPGALERVGRYFSRHQRVGFVNSDVNHIDGLGRFMRRHFVDSPCHLVVTNLGRHSMLQPGCFWRREAYMACGGLDVSLRFCMDRDLFIRLMQAGPSRWLPGKPTAEFRHHDAAKSSTILDVAQTEGQMLVDRYSKPFFRNRIWLVRRIWGLWKMPARTRKWMQGRLGFNL